MEFRQIETESEQAQFIKLLDYCFKDEIGWTSRMFPLPPEDRAVGLFDGKELVAAMLAKGFTSHIFGETVPSNGIACVVTAPQHRNQRLIREILNSVLREEFEKGLLYSALYPFRFGFYQKFGYGSLGSVVAYIFDPMDIRLPDTVPGRIVPFDFSNRHLDDLFSVYNQWVQNFDFGIVRPKPSLEEFKRNLETDGVNVFLYYDEENECRGCIQLYFKTMRKFDIRMKVQTLAWTEPTALNALTHLLWSHRDQCRDIKWTPPPMLPMSWLTNEPRVEQYNNFSWMARPLHIQKLLEMKAALSPADEKITVSVQDEIINENTGTYLIEGLFVKKEPFREENVLSVHLFSSLLFGGLSLKQAKFAGLADMSGGEASEKFFALNRNIFLSEKF